MKHFSLTSKMTNMRGVFYPTGHVVLMFPTEADATRACELLRKDGIAEEELSVAGPEEFERQIIGTTGDDDLLLPSIGTESETARHFSELAHAGQHALVVHANAKLTSDHVMEVLKDSHVSYGQRYRFLVIEDLVCD